MDAVDKRFLGLCRLVTRRIECVDVLTTRQNELVAFVSRGFDFWAVLFFRNKKVDFLQLFKLIK